MRMTCTLCSVGLLWLPCASRFVARWIIQPRICGYGWWHWFMAIWLVFFTLWAFEILVKLWNCSMMCKIRPLYAGYRAWGLLIFDCFKWCAQATSLLCISNRCISQGGFGQLFVDFANSRNCIQLDSWRTFSSLCYIFIRRICGLEVT